MKTRALVAAIIAGALAFAPSAATAVGTYPAPEDSLACSATQTMVDNQFTCTISGPEGHDAQLQTTFEDGKAMIAGTVTSEPRTIVDNVATFTVTAPDVKGSIAITSLIDGVMTDTASVKVMAVSSDAGANGADSGEDDGLAQTGFDNTWMVLGAGILLVVGAVIVVVAARRRRVSE